VLFKLVRDDMKKLPEVENNVGLSDVPTNNSSVEFLMYRKKIKKFIESTKTQPKGPSSSNKGTHLTVSAEERGILSKKEKLLKESMTQQYLDVVDVMVLILNKNEQVQLINKKGCDILGHPEKEIIGQNWFDNFIPEEDRESVRDAFHKMLAGDYNSDQHSENPVITKTGEQRIISWKNVLLRDKKNNITSTLSSGQDITSWKLAEAELRASEEKYRSFFEEDLTGDYISTPEGKLLICNPAFLRIFGFMSVEEAQKTPLVRFYRRTEERVEFLNQLRKEKKLENVELELRRVDGKPVYVSQNVSGFFDKEGNLIQIKGYLYDITSHKKMEEQFWQAQKMEAVGRLAGGVAHDFNNMLSVISGYTELLTRKLPEDSPLRRDIKMIKQASEKAESLTQHLLAFSRRQIMRPINLNLNELINELRMMLERMIGEDIELIIKAGKSIGNVKADPGQIEQALMNMAVNARDAMPGGGTLIIETANIDLNEGIVHRKVTMQPGSYVLLTVSDTGVGMDQETQANIFEPFFTTKEKGKGTGLGLSTVYGVVKQSGGYIWVYSEPGQGTTFKIYLPRVAEMADQLPVAEQPPERLHGTETVLLVEDDEGVRSVCEVILGEHGYKVFAARNGEEALKFFNRSKGAVDLLVTDVVMPGISGPELAGQTRPFRTDMRVLYVSGYAENAIVHHGKLDPGISFLQKPFSPNDLLRRVRKVLDTV
jgi:two-component system cell cycle sensor histidine kinase/response regulator CckA